MNKQELELPDEVLRFLWKNSKEYFGTGEIAKAINQSKDDVESALELIVADRYAISPHKAGPGEDTPYTITPAGFSFMSKTNYVNDQIRYNTPHSITTNNFSGITNSTIFNQSSFENAFNQLSGSDQEIGFALEIIKNLVQQKGDPELADTFDSFNDELSKNNPRKGTLKALWNSIVFSLPILNDSTDLIEKVRPLVHFIQTTLGY